MLSLRFLKDSSRLFRRFSTLSIDTGRAAIPLVPLAVNKNDIDRLTWNFAAYPRIAEITPPTVGGRLNIVDPLIRNEVCDPSTTLPLGDILDKIESDRDLELPATVNNRVGEDGIQAAVLIGIRRRKMKKHKLKKLRKKMKFEWAKVRQRRELRKEKAFQAVLIAQIKEAEKFSAEAYVSEKLRLANETPIPRFWKGKRLPEFLIKELMGIK